MNPLRPTPAARRSRRGFSLVEISLALLVISIGLLALVGLAAVQIGMLSWAAMRGGVQRAVGLRKARQAG